MLVLPACRRRRYRTQRNCDVASVGGAVHGDDWDVRVVEGFHSGANGIGVSGVDDDHVSAGGFRVAQLVRLGCCVIGGVLDVQFNAKFVSLSLCAVAQFDEEWVGLRRQRQGDRPAAFAVGAFAAVTRGSAQGKGSDGGDS